MQNWSISLIFFFMSGFYCLKAGNLDKLLAAGGTVDLESWIQNNINGNLTALEEEQEEQVADSDTGMVVVLAWNSGGYTTTQNALARAFQSAREFVSRSLCVSFTSSISR